MTMILRELSERQDFIVFKGGTSLSKCHKAIKREYSGHDVHAVRWLGNQLAIIQSTRNFTNIKPANFVDESPQFLSQRKRQGISLEITVCSSILTIQIRFENALASMK